jgi:phosphatidylinositol alpha-1,6-mannosyltransferase
MCETSDKTAFRSENALGHALESYRGSRTRVLLLSDSFLPHAGGSREYYNALYRNLVDLGDTQITVVTKKVKGWKRFDRTVSSKFFRIKRIAKPLASLKYYELPKGVISLLHTGWHILRESPEIIHAGDLYPPGLIALLVKKILGLPYVIYCHGEEITQTDRYRHQPRARNCIYRNADAVVANSDFARENLLRIGVENARIHKITPGVDAVRFSPARPNKELLERYGLTNKTVLLTVARLVPRKGHRLVLQAFAKIASEFPEAHYLIVGTGPEEHALRRIAEEMGLSRRVTFSGYVEQEQLPEIYRLCDVMVMPNREEDNGDVEGFGMVFLEASATGKPVLGGRSGGAIEAVADARSGFLVNPDDAEELALRLRGLLLDPILRERLGSAGLQRARADFDWKLRAQWLRDVNRLILGIKDCKESIHKRRRPRTESGPETME